MYAKMIGSNSIAFAGNVIKLGDTTIVNPTEEQYREAGFLKVEQQFNMESIKGSGEKGEGSFSQEVAPRKWYYYVDNYEEKDGKIIHTHKEVKKAKPDYEETLMRLIYDRYSLDNLLKIILNGTKTPEFEKEYNELQLYIAVCRTDAKADIREWELA